MDLIHKFLNIVLPPITFIICLILLPFYLVFRFLSSVERRLVNCENPAGKVVVVTGAASGIGEQIAYEYAKRGANLVLVDLKEDQLPLVKHKALHLGSPDVITVRADVSVVEDCKHFVKEAVKHFGKLDHLVNNAGICRPCLVQDVDNILDLTSTMEVNFWGSVYSTHFALPHLRKSKGKIIVVASAAGWFPLIPSLSVYSASKAAVISFHETLRTEIGKAVGITIVTPGAIRSDMSRVLLKYIDFLPSESKEECGKAIVRSACRGDMYLAEPSWIKVIFPLKTFFPGWIEYIISRLFLGRLRKYFSRKEN